MPGSTFEDDPPPKPIEPGEFDIEADEDGNPRPAKQATDPAPPPKNDRVRHTKKRAFISRPNPQQLAEKEAAPGVHPVGIHADDRDVRIWWPKLLQEEFLSKGYQASDARLHVFRTHVAGRPTEKKTCIQPVIIGEQVLGHENQTPGEALVEFITQIHHPEARGAASYQIRVQNMAVGSKPVGPHGLLDLEPISEIEARQRRLEQMQRQGFAQQPAYSGRFQPTWRPPLPGSPAAPAVTVSTVPAPIPSPPVQAPANDANAMMFAWAQQIVGEALAAQRENRQPVIPQMPAITHDTIPAPGLTISEDERMARIAAAASKATIDALISAGVIKPPAPPPPPPKDPLDVFYEEQAREEKKAKLFEGWARRSGWTPKDELPDVEVPAPATLEKEEIVPREGQGRLDFMFERLMADPKGALEAFSKILDGPLGRFLEGPLKKMMADRGMLPSIPAVGYPSPGPGANGAGGGGGFPSP